MDAARRPRVLIVEDNAAVGGMLGDMLRWLGVDAQACLEAREALAELEANDRYDLLVTDVYMPEMNGWDLAEAARARRVHLRVLLITAYPSPDVCERARQAGLGLLSKPFTMETLEAAVQSILAPAGHDP